MDSSVVQTGEGVRRLRMATAASTNVLISRKMSADAAASVGETRSSASSHICFGRVELKPPVTNIAIVNSSSEVTKANRKADTAPGASNGQVTRHNLIP